MRRFLLLFSTLLLVPVSVAGQNTPKDSQTLKDLLAEVRQLRQDLQTTTVAVERAEILLYRVRSQQEAVTQATEHLSQVRSELAGIRKTQKELSGFLKRAEETSPESPGNPAERKDLEDQVPILKARLDGLAVEEQEKQAEESDAEQRLRDEQGKLADLQAQLDRLDDELRTAGQPSPNPQQ